MSTYLPWISLAISLLAIVISAANLIYQHLLSRDELLCGIQVSASRTENSVAFGAVVTFSNPGTRSVFISGGALRQSNEVSPNCFEGAGRDPGYSSELPLVVEKGAIKQARFNQVLTFNELAAYFIRINGGAPMRCDFYVDLQFVTVTGENIRAMRRIGSFDPQTKAFTVYTVEPVRFSRLEILGRRHLSDVAGAIGSTI